MRARYDRNVSIDTIQSLSHYRMIVVDHDSEDETTCCSTVVGDC